MASRSTRLFENQKRAKQLKAMHERYSIKVAINLVITEDKKVLMLRRFNTGWQDGNYTVPSGHLEAHETLSDTVVREAMEETGVRVEKSDLRLVHVMHMHKPAIEDGDRLTLFFATTKYSNEPRNTEPETCDDLKWFSQQQLPDNTVPYVRQGLIHIQTGSMYSEIGWNDS